MQKLFAWGFTIALASAFCSAAMSEDAPVVSLNEVTAHTHIHGLAVERNGAANLLVATHHGLFRVDNNGGARLISPVQDFMGFSPHPEDASVLFASGHPPSGGNLGFIRSDDGGVSWRQVSPGADGDTADFHQMTVALSEPNIVFGSYRGRLQASRDEGASFEAVGPSPDGLIALTSRSFTELYAATEFGLLESVDGGKSWRTLIKDAPIATVLATADGAIWAFDLNRGLVRRNAGSEEFVIVSDDWKDRVLIHLAVDPGDPKRMFASTGKFIWRSLDGGQSWGSFQ